MSRFSDFAADLKYAFERSPGADGDDQLIRFLESHGFAHGSLSATNLRLLAELLPAESVYFIVYAALSTPSPHIALNGLERISTVLEREDLFSLCDRKISIERFLAVCGSSPYLTNSMRREPHLIRSLFIDGGIETRRTEGEMLSEIRGNIDEKTDYHELFPILRRFKVAEVMRIASRDLNGLATLDEVTAELSSLASASLQIACEVTGRTMAAEYGTPMMRTQEGEREADIVVLGMGKFGGMELNFSSDIDIIYIYSSDEGETSGVPDKLGGVKGKIPLHTYFVKMAEMVTKAVSQVTEDGFVFRVDLGLRPEGKGGEIAVSLESAENYYQSWGQSWERAAMLKARPVAGSLELGERFLYAIKPFIYRKYLDYYQIEDMMVMKKKIDASLARDREAECNIKLGRGGIREIEFFIQALQLVYAGKNRSLRLKNSLEALAALKEARIIQEEDFRLLDGAYRFLRTVEHRVQMVHERQTHNIPRRDEEFLALARRCGYLQEDGAERFRRELETHRSNVTAIYGGLFLSRDERIKEEVKPETYFFFDPKADPDLVKDMLAEIGFRNPESAYESLILLRDGPPRVHMTEKLRRTLEKISPLIFQEIISSPDPDMALSNLDSFLRAIGSRSSFYALLAENRDVLKLTVSIFGMSEFLSKISISHPELLDSMTAYIYASCLKKRKEMEEELSSLISQAEHFEDRLDILRRYRYEEFLRIGMNDIHGKVRQTEIALQLTWLAEACLAAACEMARDELGRFGRPTYVDDDGVEKEASLAVLGMGKMGGYELNYHSDLDIIYVFDREGETNGEKRISNHEYFAKLGQKIISILITQTREGYVYKIDTRLRPSGNAGPLVTSLDSFKIYHKKEAQIWERQALAKARVVYGDGLLKREIEEVIESTVYGIGADESVRNEINRLRMRMEAEIAKEGPGSYNIKTGRGGMVDVEFIVQYIQLRHGKENHSIRSTNTVNALQEIKELNIIPVADCDTLIKGYKYLRRLENRLRIIHDYSINDLGGSKEYLDKLARRLGYDRRLKNPGDALMRDYEELAGVVREVYNRILGAG